MSVSAPSFIVWNSFCSALSSLTLKAIDSVAYIFWHGIVSELDSKHMSFFWTWSFPFISSELFSEWCSCSVTGFSRPLPSSFSSSVTVVLKKVSSLLVTTVLVIKKLWVPISNSSRFISSEMLSSGISSCSLRRRLSCSSVEMSFFPSSSGRCTLPWILTGGFSIPWLRSSSLEPLISLGKCKCSFAARLILPHRIAACISSSALSSKSSRSSANALDCGSVLKSKCLWTVGTEIPFMSSSAPTEPLPSSAVSLSLLKSSFSRVRLTSGVVCVSSTFVDKLPCLSRPFDSEPTL